MDSSVCEGAAKSKSIDIEVGYVLAQEGDLDGIKWAFETQGIVLGPMMCYFAAVHGHLDILKWARANGWTWYFCLEKSLACSQAAARGHLDVVTSIVSDEGGVVPHLYQGKRHMEWKPGNIEVGGF